MRKTGAQRARDDLRAVVAKLEGAEGDVAAARKAEEEARADGNRLPDLAAAVREVEELAEEFRRGQE